MGHFLYISPFQSTLPVWGGTFMVCLLSGLALYFNPPSPCGEGLLSYADDATQEDFNPPSPCGEGPYRARRSPGAGTISIHPPRVGRDPRLGGPARLQHQISIHPPRVGRDLVARETLARREAISIHPPRVGRDREIIIPPEGYVLFQSTLPVWGGTPCQFQGADG